MSQSSLRRGLIILSAISTIVSLVFIIIMALDPTALLPKSMQAADSSSFLGSFVLARTLPLTIGFFWLLWRSKYQELSLYLWLLAVVQLGDVVISLAYNNVGAAIGPAVSTLIYIATARILHTSTR